MSKENCFYMRINVVYRDMREKTLPAGECAGSAITWSSRPIPKQDVYFYVNSYSRPADFAADGLHFLYISEPLCVYPDQYRRAVWRRFDAVYTWNPSLVHPAFRNIKRPFCGFPHPVSWNQSDPSGEMPDWAARRQSLCMINNNKRSLIEGELYSERVRVAHWFHEDGQIACDVFGKLPFPLPNYRGEAPHGKLSTIQQYRFALCFENLNLNPWSRGYVTEKLFDCLAAETIPVYWGAYDIENVLPADCYIDFRRFSSLATLRDRLTGMSEAEWSMHADAMRRYWRDNNPVHHWHWQRVYENVIETVEEIRRDPNRWQRDRINTLLPADYPLTAGSKAYLGRFYLSCFFVRYPTFVSLGLRTMAALTRTVSRPKA